MTEEKEPTPLGGWPCERRVAHKDHDLTVTDNVPEADMPARQKALEERLWCPGVQAHPATMIGRTWRPT